jgi:hypothetical protein
MWSGGGNLAPGPLGSVAGDPDRHRGWLLCPSSVPADHRPAPQLQVHAPAWAVTAILWQSVLRPAQASFFKPLLSWLSQVMRIGAVRALHAGVHVACTYRVCAPHMLCACVSGGTACFIGIVCVRECGPVRVNGTSDREPTQVAPNPPNTAQ